VVFRYWVEEGGREGGREEGRVGKEGGRERESHFPCIGWA